jgi:ferric hydroxamate transport system substrate-binding protein
MRSVRSLVMALTAVVALLLSACGTTGAPAGAQPAGGDGGQQITITDSRGKKVTLDGPADRVVALEWNAVEHLLSLGVQPVGVSDVGGYNAWVNAEPLPAGVKDVGIRGEPSMDSIASLRPDLIVATTDVPMSAVNQMEELAPVMVLRSADASDPIGQMRQNVKMVATATGTEPAANKLLARFDAKVAATRKALAKAGVTGDRFFFGDGYVQSGQVYIRPFADGSLISALTERLGMENAWPGKGDPAYGLDETDVEGLTRLNNVDHFLYYHNTPAGGPDPFTEGLAGNAVWSSLPFVKSHDVHRLPDGIWVFGGPASMMQYMDALVAELT